MHILMPDHIHYNLFVKKEIPEHLDLYIEEFRNRVNARITATGLCPELLLPGYNDKICKSEHQIHAFSNYIMDNPRRYLLRKQNQYLYFRKRDWRQSNGKLFSTFGNHFLLDMPEIGVVRYSRKFTEAEWEAKKAEAMDFARRGNPLVSPFIHKQEKILRDRILNAGGSIIQILANGFPERYKPAGASFDLCLEGRLLQIGPAHYTGRKIEPGRALFMNMNAMAERIAAHEKIVPIN